MLTLLHIHLHNHVTSRNPSPSKNHRCVFVRQSFSWQVVSICLGEGLALAQRGNQDYLPGVIKCRFTDGEMIRTFYC